VRVLGDVVSVEDKEPLRLTLDDGSGLLNCVLWSADQVLIRAQQELLHTWIIWVIAKQHLV
jgi:hypothetical protein